MFCTLQQVVYLTVRLLFVDFKFGGCVQTSSLRMNSVKSGFSKKLLCQMLRLSEKLLSLLLCQLLSNGAHVCSLCHVS